jgi:short subunit dehydrogenase-like uncharacterized protein
MRTDRTYDLVLFGATGFTGQLVAEYLAQAGGPTLRWALAGRNPDKLRVVRARLTDAAAHCRELPLIEADVDDAASLQRLARSARVVITTVGPYVRYGEGLVEACVAAGTDYVDLTGEPEFVDRMWLKHDAGARASGARIVHCCGFDSIPHDLGCWFTVQQLPENVPLRVEGFVRAGGSFSGGTLHSAITAFSRLGQYAQVARARRRAERRSTVRRVGSIHRGLRYVRQLGTWTLPMPTIDPQIVRRSAAAIDRYGPDFRYGHFLQVKKLPSALALAGGAGAALVGSQFSLTRERLLALREPGQGPDAKRRAKGWFRVTFLGEGGGRRVRCEVSGGDPGYGETAKMLAESALCLAHDALPPSAGVLTPAQAMGDALITRLQRAGVVFRVVEVQS